MDAIPNNKLAGVEALLFIHGEPLSIKKIGEVLGVAAEEAAALVDAYAKCIEGGDRGLTLAREGDEVQLVTKPEWNSILERFVKTELSEDLTPASVETLAIVSYFGPLSRMRIDYQRGVNSSFILRNLLLRGLIERTPDPAHPNSFLYRPSFALLRHLGIERRELLPDYEKFQSLLTSFESQNSAEAPPVAEP